MATSSEGACMYCSNGFASSRSHERTISVEVSGHNLESSQTLRFPYNAYMTNQFQTTFAQEGTGGGGGGKIR
jgi:hypothetical protein